MKFNYEIFTVITGQFFENRHHMVNELLMSNMHLNQFDCPLSNESKLVAYSSGKDFVV